MQEFFARLFGAEYRYRAPTLRTSPYQRRFKYRNKAKNRGAFGQPKPYGERRVYRANRWLRW